MANGIETVLITGAAGSLGNVLRTALAGRYRLRLTDIGNMGAAAAGEDIRQGDLADPAFSASLCDGCQAIVHLAAEVYEKDWATILHSNFQATINIYEAALRAGVDRVIFASSNHAIGMYSRRDRLDPGVPARPDSRYGLSKAFGEDLGAMFAYKHGIKSFCIRIGTCEATPPNARALSTWLSFGDFTRLVRVGLEADYLFEIVYGVSKVRTPWWDIANAERLGYRPQDDAEAYRDAVGHIVTDDPVREEFQGAIYASTEFTFDIGKVPRLVR